LTSQRARRQLMEKGTKTLNGESSVDEDVELANLIRENEKEKKRVGEEAKQIRPAI
jgi:hypothetical protein